MIKYLIYIVIVIITISCSNNSELPEKEAASGEIKIDNPDLDINPDSSEIMKQPENKGSNLLKAEQLKDFLPSEIKGLEKFAPNYGGTIDGKHSWTSASCEYYHKSGGFYSISLFDYGNLQNVPDREMFDKAVEVSGFETGIIEFDFGKAYFKWQPDMRSGELFALSLDRFIVQIKAHKLPKNSPDMEYALRLINFKEIKKNLKN